MPDGDDRKEAGARAAPRESTGDRVERFRAWVEAYATALESGQLEALDRLFAVEATLRPGPFSAVLRGRRAIRGYIATLLVDRLGLAVQARALGVGSTYAIAHWVAAWQGPAGSDGEGSDHVADSILLAAFDPFGRCTSLREWSVESQAGGSSASSSLTGAMDTTDPTAS